MAGEGQMLQAAREEKQWSYVYTEEITKIRVRYIKALEEEQYSILPGATYVKGYLRTYAKQLGLNSDDIIALYNATAAPEPVLALEVPNSLVKIPTNWVRPAVIGGIAALAIVLFIAIAAFSRSGSKVVDPSYTPAALPSAPQAEAVTPAPSPVVPTPPSVVASTPEGLTAQLVFTQKCWMEFKIDGQPSSQAVFEAGTTKELKGTSKIELIKIGNATGLSVTLNGKALPSFKDGGKVVNNVILNQETLKTL